MSKLTNYVKVNAGKILLVGLLGVLCSFTLSCVLLQPAFDVLDDSADPSQKAQRLAEEIGKANRWSPAVSGLNLASLCLIALGTVGYLARPRRKG